MNQVDVDAELMFRRKLARIQRRKRLAGLPLGKFITEVSPHFTEPTHLQPVLDALSEAVVKPVRLIVTVPPRHSKSESLLHFAAQVLAGNPGKRVAYASYAQTFSETQAIKAHRYAKAAGVVPHPNMQSRSDWQTKDGNGGGLFATSIGGGFTGRGADLLIIDDPVSNREQANSPTYRNKTWDWFEDVAETRLEPGASVVVVLTRWHEDDLAGRIIANRPEYTVIRIPALADHMDALGKEHAPDLLGRELDEPLWPERYPLDALNKIREDKPYTFASLYQGLPRPKGDRVFGEPAHYSVLPEFGYRTVIGTDLAFSKNRKADHSAAVVYLVVGDKWYVRHVERWQDDINGSVERLKRLHKTYGGTLFVEGNGPQKATVDLLKHHQLPVEPVMRGSDKYTFAGSFIDAWNNGEVLLPDPSDLPRSWYADYVEELLNFTGVNDATDDQVDASVNGFIRGERAPDAHATIAAMTAANRSVKQARRGRV